MATKTITLTETTCDWCADEVKGSDTIPFAVRGETYEIDVCRQHAREVKATLTPLIKAARKTSGTAKATRKNGAKKNGSSRPKRSANGAAANGATAKDVREWAQEQGIEVPAKGRLPGTVLEAYQAAH